MMMEQLPQHVRNSLRREGYDEAKLVAATDKELLRLPGIGKRAVERVRELQGMVTTPKPQHRAADRLWLAGMAMQGLLADGLRVGVAERAVVLADALLEALDV
jgi:hypothetical protein